MDHMGRCREASPSAPVCIDLHLAEEHLFDVTSTYAVQVELAVALRSMSAQPRCSNLNARQRSAQYGYTRWSMRCKLP